MSPPSSHRLSRVIGWRRVGIDVQQARAVSIVRAGCRSAGARSMGWLGIGMSEVRGHTQSPSSTASRLGLHVFGQNGDSYVWDPHRLRVARLSAAAADLLARPERDLCRAPDSEPLCDADRSVVRAFGNRGTRREIPSMVQKVERRSCLHTPRCSLALARACNLSCRYCYEAPWDKQQTALMSEDVAGRAIGLFGRYSSKKGPEQVTFFGGEPLLNSRLLERVVAWTQKATPGKVFYSLTTNAVVFPNSVMRLIRRHNFGLKVSIDGGSEIQNHLRPLRGGGPSFPHVIRNVDRLKKHRRSVSARVTLTLDNLTPRQIAEELAALGFTRVGIGLSTGRSWRKGPHDIHGPAIDRLLSEFEFAASEAETSIVETGKAPGWFPFERMLRKLADAQPWSGEPRCGFTRGVSTVDTDGTIYPCHRFIGMDRFRTGDVWRGFDDLRIRELLRSYAQQVESSCRDCWAYPLCRGPCPWYIAHEDGGFRPPDDDSCRLNRRFLELAMVLHWRLSFLAPEYMESNFAAERSERGGSPVGQRSTG